MKPKKDNVHKGHRERLKNTYKATGLDSFPDHNVLELLLFFGIPYKDTNEISHDLISKFGSISNVFEADIDSLKSIHNMTENAAILINLIGNISRRYFINKSTKKESANNFENIKQFLLERYVGITEETVLLLLFDKNNNLVDCLKINEGYTKVSEVRIGKIVKIANLRNINKIVLCHNHPDNTKVSTNDIVSTRKLAYHLKSVDIKLLESYIVTDNTIIGICETGNIK